MHNFRVLKLLDGFHFIFKRFAIDYPILRHILATKLLMDKRRTLTLFDDTKTKRKTSFFKVFWIYFLYSFILVFFVFGHSYMLQMSIIFGIALFILMTTLIADFSPVMLDIRDRSIMGTKPIDKRTLGVAKFLHILVYLIQLTGAFTIIPIIFMLFVQGFLFTCLFIIILAFFILFIIAFTSLIYMFVLRFFSGEQLKNMINYIQITFAIGIIIGYQIIIRSYGFVDLNAAYIAKWWHTLLPPMWFAAPFELVINHNTSIEVIILSLFALIIPLGALFLYYSLIPTFENNIQKLLESTVRKTKKDFSIENLWTELLCRTEKSRIYFQIIYKIVNRERAFKLKVYPSLGIGLVLPFIFIFSEVGVRSIEEITTSQLYFCIYLMHIFIGIAIYAFQFSSNHQGAWIFALPGDVSSSQMYAAVVKVFIVKFYLPMFIFVGIPYYIVFNGLQMIDLVIVFISAIIQALLSYKLAIKASFPFSLPFDASEGNENMTIAFLLMLLTVPFVLMHFLSTLLPFIIYIYLIMLIVGVMFIWQKLFKSKQT